jgi:hypothetical protein
MGRELSGPRHGRTAHPLIRDGVADLVRAHGGDGLAAALQSVLRGLPEGRSPVRGEHGGRIDPCALTLTLLTERRVCPDDRALTEFRVGVFFTETVGGCSCGDEPFAVSGYQELTLLLDAAACTLEVHDIGC